MSFEHFMFKSISAWRKNRRDFFLVNLYLVRSSQQVIISWQMKMLDKMHPWDLDFVMYIESPLEKWVGAGVSPRSSIGQEWSEIIHEGQQSQIRKRKPSLLMDIRRLGKVRFYLGNQVIKMRDTYKDLGKKFSGPRVKKCGEIWVEQVRWKVNCKGIWQLLKSHLLSSSWKGSEYVTQMCHFVIKQLKIKIQEEFSVFPLSVETKGRNCPLREVPFSPPHFIPSTPIPDREEQLLSLKMGSWQQDELV